MQEFMKRKYHWPSFYYDVKDYMNKCNICLALKTVQYKLYGELQSLPIFIYCWKDLLMNFVTGLLISTDWKKNSYDLIFLIINRLTKMVYYKPVKITIDAKGLVEIIFDIIIRYYGPLNLIVTN